MLKLGYCFPHPQYNFWLNAWVHC